MLKKTLIALIMGAVMLAGAASAAEAAPKKQCIYMVKGVQKFDYGYQFEFIVWKKKGRKVRGQDGASYSEYTDHRLIYKPRKNKAIGWYEDYITGVDVRTVYKTKGRGNNLRVVKVDGKSDVHKRISKKRMAHLTPGFAVGPRGCQA